MGSAGNLNGKTGHLTKIIDNLNNAKNREYEFDAVGRLTKAKGGLAAGAGGGSADWTQAYTYDRYGNRTSVTAAGTAADSSPIPLDGLPNLAYDATSNRITTTGFQYDVAGNQIKAPDPGGNGLLFEYDAANRIHIIKKESDGSYVQAFQYGSTNSRLIDYDATAGLNKFYASVGGTTLAEYIEYTSLVLTWTKTYTYLGSTQLATVTPNGTGGEYVEFNHPGRLGTRLQTNQAGGTSYEQTTLPFGTALNAESSLTTNNKRFTSYDRSNATGLDYAVNRTYDSKQGRFTQVDPIGISATSLVSPQTLNMYTYCGNDPVNYVDPSGLFWGTLFRWLARIFGFISRNRRAIAAIVSVALVVAPQGFRRIAGPIVGILNGVGNLLGSGFAGAIGVEIGRNVNRILNAVLAGVGAIASAFQSGRVELSGEARKQWEVAKFVLLSMLKQPESRCYKFLKSKGFDPDAIVKDLETQKPYDGFLSTNSEDFGAAGASPKDLFDNYKQINEPLDAATAPSGNIYYGNARGGIRSGLVLHENLHRQIPGLSDDVLGKKLGTWKTQGKQDSSKINKTLEKNGCK